jgi:type II secretory pathway component PulK
MTGAPDATSPRSRGAREEGVVLLLVLVLIVTTIGSVYAFARVSLLGVSSSRQRADRARAELLARSSLNVALQAIADDGKTEDPLHRALEYEEDSWAVLSRRPVPALDENGDMEVRYRIRDAGQRIDLNALVDDKGAPLPNSQRFLRDALMLVIDALPGRDEEKRYDVDAVTDAILDWIDADDMTRLGDVESKVYTKRDRKGPLNRRLLSLGELADVPGVDRRLLNGLDAYFSPTIEFPRSGGGAGVNPNTAPPHVLSMIYLVASERDARFIKEDDVFRTLKARKDGQLFCPGDNGSNERCTTFNTTIGRGEAIFPPLQYQSNVFTVEIEARTGDARACLRAVVDRRSEKKGGGVLSYRLGC